MGDTNFSYKTSLPAYKENAEGKESKKTQVLNELVRLGGNACLKQIEKALHIPQSSCAGRVNDLIADGRVKYDGIMEFEGRMRKKIVLIPLNIISITEPILPGKQSLKFGS